MDFSIYTLSLVNLAIDGSLDLFSDLYRLTYSAYRNKLYSNPFLIQDKQKLNAQMIPEVLPEFELLAFRRLRIFTTRLKNICLEERHFKRFNFFDKEKIEKYERSKTFMLKMKERGYTSCFDERYFNGDSWEFELRETVIDLQQFVNNFRLIMIRAIYEDIHNNMPSYTIFDARNAVDSRIKDRMKMRYNEFIISGDPNLPLTEAPLYVFDALGNTRCKIEQHRVVSKKYYVKHIDGKRIVVLPVHYCEKCDKYMIGSQSLALFQGVSGNIIAPQIQMAPFDGTKRSYQNESVLHQLGYNVVGGKLSAAERHNILISILESRQLSFFEITATIEQNIRIFKNQTQMLHAIDRWKSDLQFISEYVLKKNM